MGSGDSHLLSALRHHLHGGGSRRESQTQAAHHVPRGCVVVMVGKEGEEELERFVVPLSYLGHPLFAPLLREAAEEYGFRHRGAVAILAPPPSSAPSWPHRPRTAPPLPSPRRRSRPLPSPRSPPPGELLPGMIIRLPSSVPDRSLLV
ncbi:unnamed protein product [Spirodela intermedia]|uniref:Uncharacterized protein n=1 Tax=Spirodela intermedia TaxID=51605 RepID=A0A7I8JBS4_SPIIN|nr:unnamed protein product [Spirodela intermedia]CAA6666902.1 unnamed protein product [Spirodela intermedia]